MKLSQYYIPATKDIPKDAKIASHQLMLKSGMISQSSAGIYTWLPLGLKVLNNISNIIKKHMNDAGAVELSMPCMQPADLWKESGRYDAYGKEMLRIKDRHDRDLLFGPTAEEVITNIFRESIKSYKDLPKNFYQIQYKFRDEVRPRFGVMRCREFLMKDAYSFDLDYKNAISSFKKMYDAYENIFKELDIKTIAAQADSGAIGGNLSYEFNIISDAGESTIYVDKSLEDDAQYYGSALINEMQEHDIHLENISTNHSITDEIYNKIKDTLSPEILKDLQEQKTIEVGHLFYFGTKYSDAMKALVDNPNGGKTPVHMGSYGIGVSRLVGAIIECHHDDKGIIWPQSIAPFKVAIINLDPKDEDCIQAADSIYEQTQSHNIEALYDDTRNRPGEKFSLIDLIGIPLQIIIGKRMIKDQKIEIKIRRTMEKYEIPTSNALQEILNFYAS